MTSHSHKSSLNNALHLYKEELSLMKQKLKEEYLKKAKEIPKKVPQKNHSIIEWERKLSLIALQLKDPQSPLMSNRHSCRPIVRWDIKKTPEIILKKSETHQTKVIEPAIIERRTKLALIGLKLGIPLNPCINANTKLIQKANPTPFITLENVDERIKHAINNPMHANRTPKEIVNSHLDDISNKNILYEYFKHSLKGTTHLD